jgi:hypothetical protein
MALLVPDWLIRTAVAAVWLYEGVWCKLLGGDPNQRRVVAAVPTWGPRIGVPFLYTLGFVETLLGAWVLTGAAPVACAIVQTGLLISLNTNGLVWSRALIHDPAGMIVKNASFLVLGWVAASLARGS